MNLSDLAFQRDSYAESLAYLWSRSKEPIAREAAGTSGSR
jgi:hypothetical protein